MKAKWTSNNNGINKLFTVLCVLIMCSASAFSQNTNNPPSTGRGLTPTSSYALSDIENINTVSGNLMFRFPLASLPAGRNGMTGAVNYTYNSKLFELDPRSGTDPNSNPATWEEVISSPQGGWRLGTEYQLYIKRPSVIDSNCAYFPYQLKLFMSFPDGSEHEFRPQGYSPIGGGAFVPATSPSFNFYNFFPDGRRINCVGQWTYETNQPITYYSVDGTFLRLVVSPDNNASNNWTDNPWTLYMPDGGRVTFNEPNTLGQRIYDRNNNFVEVRNTMTNNVKTMSRVVDQFNRSIDIQYSTQTTISYQGFGSTGSNQTLTWTVSHGLILPGYYTRVYSSGYQDQAPLPELYSVTSITPPSQTCLLPPNQQTCLQPYTFTYSSNSYSSGCGEVSSIILPSGAMALYSHAITSAATAYNIVNENYVTNKALAYHREYDGTTTPVTENWYYGKTAQPGGGWMINLSRPDGGYVTQYTLSNPNSPLDNLIYRTQNADGSVDEKYWQLNSAAGPASGGGIGNPYVKTEYHSIRDASNTLTKTAIKDYLYDKNGNITQVTEYDWVNYNDVPRPGGKPNGALGGTIKRVTMNTWHNPTPGAADSTTVSANSYHSVHPAGVQKLFLRSIQTNKICPTTTPSTAEAYAEYYYDGSTNLSTLPTAGNMTEQRNWDTTKSAPPITNAFNTGTQPPSLNPNTYVCIKNQYSTWAAGITGKLDVSMDANGNYTRYTYGPIVNGSTVTNLYPTQVVTGDNASANSTIRRTVTSEYDFHSGVVTKSVDVDNNLTTMSNYDIFGRPTMVKEAYGTPQERHTVTEYADPLRRIIVRSDLNTMDDKKIVKISHFDKLGRIRLSRELENPVTQNATVEADGIKVQTRYAYTGSNMCTVVSAPYRAATCAAATSEPGMGWTRTKYDSGGRLIESETFSGGIVPAPWGANSTSTGKVTTAYDGECTTVTDQAQKVRRSVVDGCGRLIRVDEPDATGNLGPKTDPTQKTEYTYDLLNNLLTTSQVGIPNGGTTAVPQSRTFVYSSLGRLISASNPESGTTSYQYDNNGNLTRKTDARGIFIEYTYDGLNRNLTVDYSNTSLGVPDLKREYDTALYGKGKLAKDYAGGDENVGQTVESRTINSYDALGRPLSVSQRFKTNGAWSINHTYTTTQSYNLAGVVTTMTYPAPANHTITNTYNDIGQLTQFTGTLGNGALKTYAAQITYNAQGQMLRERFNESTSRLYHNMHYNRRGQLYDIRLGTNDLDEWTSNRGALRLYYNSDWSDQNYMPAPTYANNNGNLYRLDHFVPTNEDGSQWCTAVDYYSYDTLNRVTQIAEQTYAHTGMLNASTFSQNYSYDRFGNRLISSMAGTNTPNPGFKLNGANNRLIALTDANGDQGGSDKMQYDAAGNQIKDANTQAGPGNRTFDAESRMLTAVGINGYTHSYVYNADGRRTRRIVNGPAPETWWQVYGVDGELVAEYQVVSGNPVLKKEYGHRNGQLLIVADVTSSTCQWLVTDHLGTPRIIADQTGSLAAIKRHDYLPFGEEIFANVGHRTAATGYAGNSMTTQPPRQQFTNYERDSETGLDFAQARYYGSVQGRFTSVDPGNAGATTDDPQTWNAYVYVGNHPTTVTDPSGLTWAFSPRYNELRWYKDEKEFAAALGNDTSNWIIIDGQTFDVTRSGAVNGSYLKTGYRYRLNANGHAEELGNVHTFNPAGELALQLQLRAPAINQALALAALPYAVGAGVATGGSLFGIGGFGFGTTVTTLGLSGEAAGVGATTATAIALPQFSASTITQAVRAVMSDPNRIYHIFGQAHHAKIGQLVQTLGGQSNTIQAVLNAVNGSLPATGNFCENCCRSRGYC